VAIDVFLSVGRTANEEQERFVAAVERCLLEHGLQPHALGRRDWSSVQPLQAVHQLMQRCAGTAVVSFERLHITQGRDVGATSPEGDLADTGLPTVWNQIEATMAYTHGHPLLVFAQDGLRSEGLLESRYDWMVQWMELDPDALQRNPCLGMVKDWRERVVTFHESRTAVPQGRDADLANRTVAEILGELRPGQLRALIGVCITVLVAAFTLGATLAG
jgi:hypothetical protein